MFESGSSLWQWLASQPPFVEVAIGMSFVLIVAPLVLAAVALACTKSETLAQRLTAERLTIRPLASNSEPTGPGIAPTNTMTQRV